MQDKTITQNKRATVYTEGKLAFEEHEHRARNPYAANNLVLAVKLVARLGHSSRRKHRPNSAESPSLTLNTQIR